MVAPLALERGEYPVPTVPYKVAATEVALIPVDAELSIPDLRWLAGGLLLTSYLSICWLRSARALRLASP